VPPTIRSCSGSRSTIASGPSSAESPATADQPITQRELNRALLERQLLLGRVDKPVGETVEHLLGLQAQATLPPYYGLWSRLDGFDAKELGRMLTDRLVVRLTLMRGTVHLVTVRDALTLRPLVQRIIERTHNGTFGRRMGGADLARLAAAVRELLGDEPLTARELGTRLVERGIGDEVEAIGNAARVYVPLVQVPPRGVWGAGGQAKYLPLETWTGMQLETEPSIDELVLRYLGSFGPASVMDVQSWSGLTKLKEVFDRLRPRLVTLRDERGRELFDVPDAPRPDPETPAPVRFLGEYDNVLLGHADRRRIIPEDFPWAAMLAPGRFVNNLLVDGVLRATWWIEREGKKRATLAIRPSGRLSRAERTEVGAEAERMLEFAAADAESRDVRLEPAIG
jgi:Winged helix DNA-binding domain